MFSHGSGKKGGGFTYFTSFSVRPTEIYEGEFTNHEDQDEFVNLKLYGSQRYSNPAKNE